ncbi:MAG: Gfo/Idh/MocA family oxidoreductase [Opitutales bacterium]|nr:Gfo/Idh/MocA family oxidoreductase [Opitutales bacterium]
MKIGIIGAGGMLDYHLNGFKQAGASVQAIADVRLDAAQAAAANYGIPSAFGSVEELLSDEGLDAVSVIVPNKFHADLSIQCLKAGKHVFCEKPPALNAREVEGMIEAANQSGKTLMFNFNNRARPLCQLLKSKIDAGDVGLINSAQAKWIRRKGIPGFGGWFTQKKLSGGGPLIDLLHMLDLSLYFMGYPKPKYVSACTFDDFIQDKSFKGPWGLPDVKDAVNDVESASHGFITFETGQALSFQISWAELVKREEVSVTFQGKKAGGMVRRLFEEDGIDDTSFDEAELYTQVDGIRSNECFVADPDIEMGRTLSAANFVETIKGEAKPLNTPEEALVLMKLIDAAYESAAKSEPVRIN